MSGWQCGGRTNSNMARCRATKYVRSRFSLSSVRRVCGFIPPSELLSGADGLWRASILRADVLPLLTEFFIRGCPPKTRIDRQLMRKISRTIVNSLLEHYHRGIGRLDSHAGKHFGIANLCGGCVVRMSARFIAQLHQSCSAVSYSGTSWAH